MLPLEISFLGYLRGEIHQPSMPVHAGLWLAPGALCTLSPAPINQHFSSSPQRLTRLFSPQALSLMSDIVPITEGSTVC